jgi:hypothetical protein
MFSHHDIADLEREAIVTLEGVPIEQLNEAKLCRTFRGASRPLGIRALPNARAAATALVEFRRGNRDAGVTWARGFMIEFLADIRKSLCTTHHGSRGTRATEATAKGAAAAIASWLMGSFAVVNPFAVALATFVVIVIGSAALSAFCTMTDEEVLTKLRQLPVNE